MDGLRDRGRNTSQLRKEEGDHESARKPPFHANHRSVAEFDGSARETVLAEKIMLLSAQ